MLLIGLTGGIASGKSTVSKILSQEYNCVIIDADLIAREVVQPGKPALNNIVTEFGMSVLNDDGTLNRTILGNIIFNDESKRIALNKITHPEIAKVMLWKILKSFLCGNKYVVLDVPLLFESKSWLHLTSYNVVVYCDAETQLNRLMERDEMNKEDANKRIQSQLPLEDKRKMASHVIDNNFSLEETRVQVSSVVKEFNKSKRYLKIWLIIILVISIVFFYPAYVILF